MCADTAEATAETEPAASSEAVSTDWGAVCDEEEDEEDLSDLLSLLDSRDAASVTATESSTSSATSSSQKSAKQSSAPVRSSQGGDIAASASGSRKVVFLEEVEEPADSGALAESGAHELHVDELVSQYLSEMRGAGSSGTGEGEGQALEELQRVEEEYRRQKVSQLHASLGGLICVVVWKVNARSVARGGNDGEEDDDDGDEGMEIRSAVVGIVSRGGQTESSSTKEGSKKQKQRVEAVFRERLSRCPGQVLRYAYGGSPLWCSYPPPDVSKAVRPCEMCGTERVFEMQLMPGLLYLLSSHAEATPSETAAAGGADGAAGLLDSADFGVVSIWSCPNSCGEFATEVAIVQPSSDSCL